MNYKQLTEKKIILLHIMLMVVHSKPVKIRAKQFTQVAVR